MHVCIHAHRIAQAGQSLGGHQPTLPALERFRACKGECSCVIAMASNTWCSLDIRMSRSCHLAQLYVV